MLRFETFEIQIRNKESLLHTRFFYKSVSINYSQFTLIINNFKSGELRMNKRS